jgi:hypothetical protein
MQMRWLLRKGQCPRRDKSNNVYLFECKYVIWIFLFIFITILENNCVSYKTCIATDQAVLPACVPILFQEPEVKHILHKSISVDISCKEIFNYYLLQYCKIYMTHC